jgi:hypothetical protein
VGPHEYRPAMGIRWDWLQPLIIAPYVPTLGPAHPEVVTPGLFADVIETARTGRFLPHDKDRRWADRKNEQVLTGAITQEPGLVLIPTLSTRRQCVKVHVYSQQPLGVLSRAEDLGRRLCDEHSAEKGRLFWFLPPGSDPDPVAACTRIQMRTFDPGHDAPAPESGIVPLGEVTGPVRATFSVFSQKLAAEGFAFLDSRIREHGGVGPVLTCQRDGKVAGAIGPMEIMPDSRGTARLLPQYFGGGKLRSAVVSYLDDHVSRLLTTGSYREETGRQLAAACGELSQLAGWVAYDSDEHGLAQRYLTQALAYARHASDSALALTPPLPPGLSTGPACIPISGNLVRAIGMPSGAGVSTDSARGQETTKITGINRVNRARERAARLGVGRTVSRPRQAGKAAAQQPNTTT